LANKNCLFCEIIKGNISTPGIFWENKEFIAFLSIFPNTQGYTVIATKKHYESDVLELPDKVLKNSIMATKEVSQILKNYFEDVGRVGVIIEGTGVNHAHIKLIPMHGTKHFKDNIWKSYSTDEEMFLAEYKGFLSSIEGPRANNKEIEKLAEELKKYK